MSSPLPEWTHNSTEQCERCATYFTLIKRRHHCRKCGAIICQACSSNELLLPGTPYKDPVRVCDGCFLRTSADISGSNGKLSLRKSLASPPVTPMKIKTTIEEIEGTKICGFYPFSFCEHENCPKKLFWCC